MPQKSILVVEDEGLIANDIAEQLLRTGYAVSDIAASGEEALASLRQSKPDLILMDIRLKGKMDGIDVALRVRADYQLPVIFLTSHADTETLARAKQAVPFGYLVKPFRQLNLCSAIEVALHKHESERALLEREAWLTTILDSTAAATIVTDRDGVVQFVNPYARGLLSLGGEDVAGTHLIHLLTLALAGQDLSVDDLVTTAIKTREVQRLPYGVLLKRPDGGAVTVEGEVAPSLFRGEIAGAVLTLRDVSERHRLEAQLCHEQKTRAIGQLAGGVAHDFNNLLTVIVGHGSLLAADLARPEDQTRMQAVLDAAHTAGELTRQLLALSGRLVLKSELVQVNDSILRMVRLLTPGLGDAVHIKTQFDPGAGQVRMNAAQLDQVLLNLLLNARDAMPVGGTVTVATSTAERRFSPNGGDLAQSFIRILVTDAGTGMSSEVRERLFEPFFTTKGAGQGTGLGLATVHGIVKDAAGHINVESTLGLGTRFEILLPSAEETPRLAEGLETPRTGREGIVETPSPAFFATKTILLAEDDPAIRAMMHRFLHNQGFHLLEAADGQAALDLASSYDGPIDLLVSDILMPNMDGPTLSQQLAVVRPGIRTLLISGYPGDVNESLRRVGLDWTFMQKPFALRNLLEKIKELILLPGSPARLHP